MRTPPDPDDGMRHPPHPGAFIRTEILEPYGLNVTTAAKALRVNRVTLSSVLNGQADLSADMALRIEKAFAVPMPTLVRMQTAYDIERARARAARVTAKVRRYRRRPTRKVA